MEAKEILIRTWSPVGGGGEVMFWKRRTCRGVPLVEYVHARMVEAMLDRDEDILLKAIDIRTNVQGVRK